MRNLRERTPIASHRRHEDDKVLDCPSQHRPDYQPQKPRHKSKLCRQHRAKQGSRPCNRGEVMAKEHDLIGGVKIDTIVQPHRRRHMLIVQSNDVSGQPSAIESIGQHIDTGRRDDQPKTVYFFIGIDDPNHVAQSQRAKKGKQHPEQIHCYVHARHPNNPPAACKSRAPITQDLTRATGSENGSPATIPYYTHLLMSERV